jgi:hypothetical protein
MKSLLSAIVMLASFAVPQAFAHHSFAAEYDGSKPVTLKGKITQFEWVNPHSWVHIDVVEHKGNVANGLYRQGWRRDSLKVGDEVVIEGYMAKDGSHTMNARSVQTPDGKKFFAGSSGDGGPVAPDQKK